MTKTNATIERWKPIPFAPGYEISSFGRLRSYWTKCTGYHAKNKPFIAKSIQRYIRPGYSSQKHYIAYGMKIENTYIVKKAAHLVLLTFVGKRPKNMEACHYDGNNQNNHLNNLRWDTRKGNMADAKRQGRMIGPGFSGETHPNATLTDKQVTKIRNLHQQKIKLCEIARKFHITPALAWKIVTYYSWKHLP